MAGALIVTAEIASIDFSWLDRLRRTHYPAHRNQLPAHLTMFHALPPSAEREVRSTLARLAGERAPKALIAGLLDLGGGVAFRIVSYGLDTIRQSLAEDFHGLLTAQDSGGWRPHITIQNKMAPNQSRALKSALERDFQPRPLGITGLGLNRYLEGPWESLATFSFRGH